MPIYLVSSGRSIDSVEIDKYAHNEKEIKYIIRQDQNEWGYQPPTMEEISVDLINNTATFWHEEHEEMKTYHLFISNRATKF